MPFGAISYGVRPGHEDEIAGIFSAGSFQRASSPTLRDPSGAVVGRLLATGLFIQDTDMVRVIQFEGNGAAIARHMGSQPGVHRAEQQIAPYLAETRDTGTVEGFSAHFSRATMRPVQQHVRRDDVATAMLALRWPVVPDAAPEIGGALAATPPISAEDGPVLATAAFVRDRTLVRIYQYEGELAAALDHITGWAGRAPEWERLRPYVVGPVVALPTPMRCISQLSVLNLPAAARGA
ncbi:histidine kinase [Micromonospora sp. NBC_00898]|uniref:SchA/CurD-like domain-containing protein n=1 Tax=Micromonospora sp. NBC_00898 TaxID=2975981 RepID=UPI00386BECC2|nr:histidine kinase [Micromonospora sp. NBC_00898]